jgi:formamidopyrimidine-DNA glycosylase
MSELPEVETVRRGLKKLIVGKQIIDVKIHNEKSFDAKRSDPLEKLVGAKVIDVRRRAKVLIIDLGSDYSLVIHLKMTGQLVYRGDPSPLTNGGLSGEGWAAGHPTDSFITDLPDRSTRVEFIFDGAKLFFNDQRKFGWIKLLPTIEVENIDFLQKAGPEPLSGDPKLPKQFLTNIRRHNNTTIKAAILNQTVIAGIGNIYADESLWCVKVHPLTRVRDITDKKLKEVLNCAIEIMTKSINSGGSTMKDYVKADGSRGDYLEKFAKVFNRDGLGCPRCGTTIQKIRAAGRGTHICPLCQKLHK